MEAQIPPMIIQMDLSVGVPEKKRETSELKESEALNPKIIRTTPPATNAIPSALFIIIFQALRRPVISDTRNKIRKMVKRIFAIVAAVPAMTPKPSTAATRATTRKIRDQLNITVRFLFLRV